jgi:hypothetical protein
MRIVLYFPRYWSAMIAPRIGVTAWIRKSSWKKRYGRLTITPELEESRQTRGTIMTHSKSTTALAAVQGSLDIVLEDTGSPIVCEALAEFDNGDQESSLG